MYKLSIVIPCYNEAQNAPLILESFKNIWDGSFELIVVDDGSKDETKKVFEKELKKPEYGFARLVSYWPNCGYGVAITVGLKEARSDILAWTHADLQTNPEDVLKAYKLFVSGEGKRAVKGGRIKRKFADWLLTLGMGVLASSVLGKKLFDINAQPKLFDREFYGLMASPPKGFSLDLYWMYLARKHGYKISTIPVVFQKRLYGESKSAPTIIGRLKTIFKTFKYIFKLRRQIGP